MPSISERIAARETSLSPSERRVAEVFRDSREEVLFASAAMLAMKAGTSDATIVRTARTLGFTGLDDLRRAVAAELKAELSQADRLAATLAEAVADPSSVLDRTVAQHVEALSRLSRDLPQGRLPGGGSTSSSGRGASSPSGWARRVPWPTISSPSWGGLASTPGPARGRACSAPMTSTASARATDSSPSPMVGATPSSPRCWPRAERLGLERVLVTDDLAPEIRGRFDVVLPVARGRSDMLSMHTATLGLVEALLVGVAAQRPDEALASLRRLNLLREGLVGSPMHLPTPLSRDRSDKGSNRR